MFWLIRSCLLLLLLVNHRWAHDFCPTGRIDESTNYPIEGQPLELNCTCPNCSDGHLYFWHGKNLSAEYLGSQTWRYYKASVSRQDEGYYYCNHETPTRDNCSDNVTTIDRKMINVRSDLKKPLECVSDNYEDMTCSLPCHGENGHNITAITWFVSVPEGDKKTAGNCTIKKDGNKCSCYFEPKEFHKIHTYTMKIRATNQIDSVNVPVTFTQKIYTDVSIVKVRPIRNLTIANINQTSLNLTWGKPLLSYSLEYRISYSVGDGAEIEEKKVSGVEGENFKNKWESAILTQLHPGVEYTVTVRCRTVNGKIWSNSVTIKAVTVKVRPIRNLTIANITQTSFNLTWEKPSLSYSFEYNISYSGGNGSEIKEKIVSRTEGENSTDKWESAMITQLHPGVKYTVTVQCRPVNGELWSDGVTAKAKTLPPVKTKLLPPVTDLPRWALITMIIGGIVFIVLGGFVLYGLVLVLKRLLKKYRDTLPSIVVPERTHLTNLPDDDLAIVTYTVRNVNSTTYDAAMVPTCESEVTETVTEPLSRSESSGIGSIQSEAMLNIGNEATINSNFSESTTPGSTVELKGAINENDKTGDESNCEAEAQNTEKCERASGRKKGTDGYDKLAEKPLTWDDGLNPASQLDELEWEDDSFFDSNFSGMPLLLNHGNNPSSLEVETNIANNGESLSPSDIQMGEPLFPADHDSVAHGQNESSSGVLVSYPSEHNPVNHNQKGLEPVAQTRPPWGPVGKDTEINCSEVPSLNAEPSSEEKQPPEKVQTSGNSSCSSDSLPDYMIVGPGKRHPNSDVEASDGEYYSSLQKIQQDQGT